MLQLPERNDFSEIQSTEAFNALAAIYGPELAAEQLQLEHEAYTLGEERFRNAFERAQERGEFSSHTTAKPLLGTLVPLLSEAITNWIEHQTTKVRRKHVALGAFQSMSAEVMASVTLRWTINRVAQRDGAPTITEMAVSIGRALEEECRYGRIRNAEQAYYQKHLKKSLAQRNGMTYKIEYMNKIEAQMIEDGKIKGQWEKWDQTTPDILYHMGIRMLELLIESTQLIEVVREHKGNKKLDGEYVYLKQEWAEKLTSRAFILSGIHPRYQPMVVQPKPWVGVIGGGYWAKGRRPVSFVRVRSKRALKRYRDVHMPEVYKAVNLAQNTAWRINDRVLAVANAVMGWANVPIKEFPKTEQEPLPIKPGDIDTNEEALKEWKKAAAAVYRKDAARVSRRLSYEFTLEQANKFSGFEAIYFPYNLDWRGRVYAIPVFNPQSNDMTKGILCAAKGERIGADGIGWLMIHGANTAGVDKVTFEERRQWVLDNEDMIYACADDPLNNTEWMQMDSPFCFLAFCFEWAGVRDHGEDWVSALPIAFDGSCSGIQHFSAMLRDERGGRAVNLLPSDSVQDIYKLVSDEVESILKVLAVSGTEDSMEVLVDEKTGEITERKILGTKTLAMAWLAYGMSRKVTKRSVMTLAYGSKAYGFTDQVRDDIVKKAIDNGEGHMFTDAGQASRFMAGLIWDSVSVVVVAAVEAMNWLQKAAKLLSSEVKDKKTKEVLKPAMPVYWTTPDGFPVWQEYMIPETRRIDLMFLGDIRIQSTVTVRDSDKIDARKQESGISPNFVHSQDGSHLRKTVVHSAEQYGIDFFALIHDSFGTIPAKAGAMFRAVRETMVSTYQDNDVLADFREQFMEQLHETQLEKMPEIPAKGTLDITQILNSEFAFA
ncbi:N4-like RNA polymerase [Pseudomonas phage Henninger]|uniref:DNA-directed RNA polymerase n=1 Tax=Pseudomonas phage Henninger TaxID=2079287 RepID=A0A2K9VHD7_9CAUD|nr:N4-like RNA polymerase [Pseudomonas phage Henninger]AUV61717.1 DNA-directed RNA polymerase [Pseudomonas phage Henninger]